jgi:hypothetical protein
MKKIIMLGITVFALILTLTGCDNANAELSEAERHAQSTPTEDSRPLEGVFLDGVEMIVQDVSSSGLSFSFHNITDSEYLYGSDFSLSSLKNGSWEPVEPIIENWGFTSEGYDIMPNSTTDITPIDWQWLLGELPSGEYRIQKSVLFIRSPGDFDEYIVEAEFAIH